MENIDIIEDEVKISCNDISQHEKNIEIDVKEGKIQKMKQRFLIYSQGQATEKELDEASFNFLGFVKTIMNIANDNEKAR